MKLSQLRELIDLAISEHGDVEAYVLGADGSSRSDIELCTEANDDDVVEGVIIVDKDTAEELLTIEKEIDEYFDSLDEDDEKLN